MIAIALLVGIPLVCSWQVCSLTITIESSGYALRDGRMLNLVS
jgi:hypothetical protein